MAILPVLQFPNPKLKLVGKQIERFDDSLISIYNDMLETMYSQDGLGLAATQVDLQLRIFVLDVSEEKNGPVCFINPIIVETAGEITWEEGCLSFPGMYVQIKRHRQITVEFQDLQGVKQQLVADELLGICIQHEIDHLDGITFFDHLSPLKKQLLRKKITKQRDNVS